jgi:hypothetical protein
MISLQLILDGLLFASSKHKLALWQTKLAAAESLRPDLKEGCEGYRHFLEGGGMPYVFSYENYVFNDQSGQTTLANAMLDIQDGAEIVWEADRSLTSFSITGGPISCGGNACSLTRPKLAEGHRRHIIWLSGSVTVTHKGGQDCLLDMVLHAEDR